MAMAVAVRAAEMVAAMRAAVGMETAVRAAEAKVAASRPEWQMRPRRRSVAASIAAEANQPQW